MAVASVPPFSPGVQQEGRRAEPPAISWTAAKPPRGPEGRFSRAGAAPPPCPPEAHVVGRRRAPAEFPGTAVKPDSRDVVLPARIRAARNLDPPAHLVGEVRVLLLDHPGDGDREPPG